MREQIEPILTPLPAPRTGGVRLQPDPGVVVHAAAQEKESG